ncbi:MAG: hypothetical protein H0V46_08500 [Sphingomonas sp.]|nr:hypothetical protein [Sphingomonas sp.]
MTLAIPVICDRCRAEGAAGAANFTDIRDLLAFDPVQRRAHVNNWTPEHQRAFIAALAITGSRRKAARAIGRHAFGAEQLRTAKGGRSFAEAWDAALELARERELARMNENLGALAAQAAEAPAHYPGFAQADSDDGGEGADARDYADGMLRIRKRLTNARRLLLLAISGNDGQRAAWEALVGPTDWDKAKRGEPQPDEPFCDPDYPASGTPRFTKADMLITAEAGFLPEFGGRDALAEVARIEAEGEQSGGGDAAERTDDEDN